MSEYRKEQPVDGSSDQSGELSRGYVNEEVTPIQVNFLQTEASLNTGDTEHLARMAIDEQYLRDQLRGQVAGFEGRFYIAKKTGSYTTDAMDLMVMLAYSRRDLATQTPEAHLYELTNEDLTTSLSLVARLRQEFFRDQSETYAEEEA